MRGTWQTEDDGPGRVVLAALAVVAVIGAAAWAAARIWWILAGAALIVAATAAMVLLLIRWSDRRAAGVFRPRVPAELAEWEKELRE